MLGAYWGQPVNGISSANNNFPNMGSIFFNFFKIILYYPKVNVTYMKNCIAYYKKILNVCVFLVHSYIWEILMIFRTLCPSEDTYIPNE